MQIFVDVFGVNTVAATVGSETSLLDLKSTVLQNSDDAYNRSFSYFSFEGKPLTDHSIIGSHGISHHSTLHLRVRVSGGGGDGGSTCAESRDCYLNMYAVKKPDKVDPNEARIAKWSRCALSSEVLRPPCVIDLLGNMYNKEALVSCLVSKSLPKELRYIRGLKDMVTIHLTSIPGISPDFDTSEAKFQCPISGQEFNGKYKFFALRSCGHVLSARALKEVQSPSCLVCFKPFAETDKIVINGTEEEVTALKDRLEQEFAAKLKDKKEKKVRHAEKEITTCDACGNGVAVENGINDGNEVVVEHAKPGSVKGTKRKEAKIEKAPAIENMKDQKTNQSSKRFRAIDIIPPNATKEVYASIFSSSSKSKIKETYMCRSLPIGRN